MDEGTEDSWSKGLRLQSVYVLGRVRSWSIVAVGIVVKSLNWGQTDLSSSSGFATYYLGVSSSL